MAVYREKRRPNPVLLALAGAGVLIVLGVLAVLLGGSRQAGETPLARTQAGLRAVADALDVFTIEYPKAAAGQASGAGPALARARQAFDQVRPDLTALDPTAAANFDAA